MLRKRQNTFPNLLRNRSRFSSSSNPWPRHYSKYVKEFYRNVLKRLREAVRRKRPEAWTNNIRMLHHDKAPAHASLLIPEFLTKHETTVVPQPPYSPDLAAVDFFMFPKLKSSLKGRRFQTVKKV